MSDILYNTIKEDEILESPQAGKQISKDVVGQFGVLGKLEISEGGHIRGGQTAYNTGTGFFLGYSTDAYKLSIGDPAGSCLTWDGSNLAITGTLTGGVFQTAVSGQRITINAADNYIKTYDADGNVRGAFGGSLDATGRLLDLSTATNQDIEMVRLLAQKTDGEKLILHTVSKGYQSVRFRNENTNAYRTDNNIPVLNIFQLGTGHGIKIGDNSTYSTGIPLNIEAPNKSDNTNPSIRITRSAGGPHFRLEGDPTGFAPTDGDIWFNGTDLFIRVGTKTYTLDKTEV